MHGFDGPSGPRVLSRPPATREGDAALASRTGGASPWSVAERRDATAVVVVPTVDEAATIDPIVRELVALRRAGVIDRVVVFDDSTDATPFIAEAAGADVIRQADICSVFGPVRGKGDAMWRSLAVCDEDVVAFVDGDTSDFSASTACDLVATIAVEGFSFVKATYRRPFVANGVTLPTGGGRVTELTAKPLLAAFAPELRAFDQPLAGEMAGRSDLLRSLPFATGYAVDVALLIDVWRSVGLERMAQVDTGVRQNRHRPLEQLAPMADEVARAILHRTGAAPGGLPPLHERPAMASLAIGEAA